MVSNGQIKIYRELAEKHYSAAEHRVVAIIANKHQHNELAHACFCWREVFRLIAERLDKQIEEVERVHLQDFCSLLLSGGLGPAAPIDQQAVRYFPTARKLPFQRHFRLMANRVGRARGILVCLFGRLGRIGLELKRKLEDQQEKLVEAGYEAIGLLQASGDFDAVRKEFDALAPIESAEA